jgi:glycosyltransferase involved in cell wall biosynthesis
MRGGVGLENIGWNFLLIYFKRLMNIQNIKVAIVHDYLHVFGGAEGVVQAIYEIFPQADIYTSTCDEEMLKKMDLFKGSKIFYPKWKNNIPGKFKRFMHKLLIANLPFYFENLDLSKYDLIISSSAHFAKGVRKSRSDQLHVSYIHTPPRFLYGFEGEIRKRSYWYWKLLLWPLDTYLRFLDQKFAQRPDYLLCNSENVRNRIKKFYNRDAKIIYPFPNIEVTEKDFQDSQLNKENFYLIISRLAAYKNIDLAIKVCGKTNRELIIGGKGPDEQMLKDIAAEYTSVKMLGFITDEKKFDLYKRCKAVLATVKDEDFGMAPLEPMLFGKPVIALKQGGYLETVDEKVGVFFEELTIESLLTAIRELENKTLNPVKIREHALKFSKDNFKEKFKNFIENI